MELQTNERFLAACKNEATWGLVFFFVKDYQEDSVWLDGEGAHRPWAVC